MVGMSTVGHSKMPIQEPKLVKWGKPSVWLSNTDPRDEMTAAEVEWMNINCIFVECNTPIFHANTE